MTQPVTSVQQALDLAVNTTTEVSDVYNPVLPPRIGGDDRVVYERILPIGGVTSGTVSFSAPAGSPASQGYLDMSKSWIRMRLPIRQRGDATSLAAEGVGALPLRDGSGRIKGAFPPPGSAELFLCHQIFSRIRTELGGIDVSDDANGYQNFSQAIYEMLVHGPEYFSSEAGANVGLGAAIPARAGYLMGVAQSNNANYPLAGQSRIRAKGGWDSGACLGDGAGGERFANPGNPNAVTLFARLVGGDDGEYIDHIEVGYRPKCGIWNTKYAIPGGLSFDLHLDKANDRMPFRSPWNPSTGSGAAGTKSELYIDWAAGGSMELMLARRETSPSVLQVLAAASLQQSLQIPFLRSRVAVRTFDASNVSVNVSALFQGPRPDVVAIVFMDQRSLQKSDDGAKGGEQISSYHWSGAAAPPAFTTAAALPADAKGAYRQFAYETNPALATPPHVRSIQVAYGTQRYPQRPFQQPLPQDVSEAYEAYRRVSMGALSKSQFERAHPVYTFDLTDSGTGRSSMQQHSSDMSSGLRGSLEITAEVVGNYTREHDATTTLVTPQPYAMLVVGYSTAAVEISAASGTARRVGW